MVDFGPGKRTVLKINGPYIRSLLNKQTPDGRKMFKSRISTGTCVVLSLLQIIAFDVSLIYYFRPLSKHFCQFIKTNPDYKDILWTP